MDDLEINSGEIISECLKEYGEGSLFFRTDGLEFEERRSEVRRIYVESHPETDKEYLRAILKAAITPGMTMGESVAAWGLLEEDTRAVFGHVTDDRRTAYAYFKGFAVGELHALYLKDDVVIGVRQTEELVPPHERELDMRIAGENGLFYFYDGNDGQLRGSNVEQYYMDWDTQHLHLYVIEIVPPCSIDGVEYHIGRKGLIREYEIALLRLGYDSRTASDELRSRVALSILPVPHLRTSIADDPDESPVTTETGPAPAIPILLPSSSLEAPEDPALVPLEKWFAYIAFGHRQEAAFPTSEHGVGADIDQVELLKVEWVRERLFRLEQVPLLVDGISLSDIVEVEWRDGNLVPRFKRVAERRGLRTVRALVAGSERDVSIRHFAKLNTTDRKRYRYEKGVLAFSISQPELDEIAKEWLGHLQLPWVYTDTLSQR